MSSQNPSHNTFSLAKEKEAIIRQHFSSPRHAQVLAIALAASVVLAGSTLAQSLSIPTSLDNSIIAIKQIFLSTDGLGTASSPSTKIKLDGTNGNVSLSKTLTVGENAVVGTDLTVANNLSVSNNLTVNNNATLGANLTLSNHPCTSPTGCVLTVNNQGVVSLTGDVTSLVGGTVSSAYTTVDGGEKYFERKGGTGADNAVYDVYFADPSTVTGTIPGSTLAKQDYVKVRIGIENNGTGSADGPQLITRGKIESRQGINIQTPTNTSNSKNLSLVNTARTHSEIANSGNILYIKSAYRDGGPGTQSSNIILKGLMGDSYPTKVGINTLDNTSPSKTLDVNGEVWSRDDLTVGGTGTNTTLFADTSTKRVGIGTSTPTGPLEIYKSDIPFIQLRNDYGYLQIARAGSNGDFNGRQGETVFRTLGGGVSTSGTHSMYFNIPAITQDPEKRISFGDDHNGVTMSVHANGRVGIGDTSPSAKLEVNGDVKISSNTKMGGTTANKYVIRTFVSYTTAQGVGTECQHSSVPAAVRCGGTVASPAVQGECTTASVYVGTTSTTGMPSSCTEVIEDQSVPVYGYVGAIYSLTVATGYYASEANTNGFYTHVPAYLQNGLTINGNTMAYGNFTIPNGNFNVNGFGINGAMITATKEVRITNKLRLPYHTKDRLLIVNSSGYLATTGGSNTLRDVLNVISQPSLWLLSGASMYSNMMYRVAIGAYDFGSSIMLGVLGSFKVVDENPTSTTYSYQLTADEQEFSCAVTLIPSGAGTVPYNPGQGAPTSPASQTNDCAFDGNMNNIDNPSGVINAASPQTCRDYYNTVEQDGQFETECFMYREFTKVATPGSSSTAFYVNTTNNIIESNFPINSTEQINTTDSISATTADFSNQSSSQMYTANTTKDRNQCGAPYGNGLLNLAGSANVSCDTYSLGQKNFCALQSVAFNDNKSYCSLRETAGTWYLDVGTQVNNGADRPKCNVVCF